MNNIISGLVSLVIWALVIWGLFVLIKKWRKNINEAPKKKAEKERKWREDYSSEITENKLKQKWGATIENMGGHGEQLMESVGRCIQNDNIPNVVVSRRTMKIEGDPEPHPFVVVSNDDPMIKAYKILITATDYGTRLIVRWYVIFDIMEVHNGAKYGKSMAETEAVSSYVAVVRSLFDSELKEIMNGLKLDFTKVDTTTRGFGNLS